MSGRRDSLERFTLTLRALPGEVPASVRVRQALKVLLRRFGLVNEGIRDAEGEADDDDARTARGE